MGVRVLHLVRHGARDVLDGDPGLNDLGRRQAAHIAERLAAMKALSRTSAKTPFPIAAIVNSTTRRTRETADIIARALPDVPRSEDASLSEGYPAAPSIGTPDPALTPETLAREAERFETCWRTFFREADAPTASVLVSHGNWIRGLTVRALGAPPSQWARLGFNHCALTTILITPEGPFVLRANDVGHLPPELITVN